MRKRDISDSESEDISGDSSSEDDAETAHDGQHQGVSEYEKQRLSRIAENKARLEALGLPKMVSSVKAFAQKVKSRKGKEKKVEDDEDYRPDEGEARSSSSNEDDENDDEFATRKASGSGKRKVKNKGLKQKAKVSRQNHCSNSDNIDDDDDDESLKQAIALSLQDSADCSINHLVNTTQAEKKGNIPSQEDKGKKKNKKSFTSRLQMTEDEVILHFFQFDEAGKGTLTLWDLQKVAVAHDFTWTNKELDNMIRYFDSDADGKLSLEDFRNIVVRCHMIKESEDS